MPYRSWLPLLLMAVLVFEGIFGAWAGTRMALHAVDGIAAEQAPAKPGCETAKRSRAVGLASAGHSRHERGVADPADDCSCVDSTGCECRCVLSLYPPIALALLAPAHPAVSLDIALPPLTLPASKLSRVFRPPIA